MARVLYGSAGMTPRIRAEIQALKESSRALDAKDPFGLAPGDIVDSIVAAGYVPAVDRPQIEPFRTLGTVTEVDRANPHQLSAPGHATARPSRQGHGRGDDRRPSGVHLKPR